MSHFHGDDITPDLVLIGIIDAGQASLFGILSGGVDPGNFVRLRMDNRF